MNTISSNINPLLTLFYLVVTLSAAFAFTFTFKIYYRKTKKEIERSASEIQQRVIAALQGEINVLKDRITELEKENGRLKRRFSLLKSALKDRGLTITINDEMVSINDEHGGSIHRITSSHTGPLPDSTGHEADSTIILESN